MLSKFSTHHCVLHRKQFSAQADGTQKLCGRRGKSSGRLVLTSVLAGVWDSNGNLLCTKLNDQRLVSNRMIEHLIATAFQLFAKSVPLFSQRVEACLCLANPLFMLCNDLVDFLSGRLFASQYPFT
jgi:hypothetical protein